MDSLRGTRHYSYFWTKVAIAGASFFIGIVALESCSNRTTVSKTTVSFASLERETLDTEKTLTLLKILKVYPALLECNKEEKYANLYICKKWSTEDTTYVFENCQKVDKLALDTSFNYPIAIDRTNLTIQYPTNVTVFVPNDFNIPAASKYFFGQVSYLTEY